MWVICIGVFFEIEIICDCAFFDQAVWEIEFNFTERFFIEPITEIDDEVDGKVLIEIPDIFRDVLEDEEFCDEWDVLAGFYFTETETVWRVIRWSLSDVLCWIRWGVLRTWIDCFVHRDFNIRVDILAFKIFDKNVSEIV